MGETWTQRLGQMKPAWVSYMTLHVDTINVIYDAACRHYK